MERVFRSFIYSQAPVGAVLLAFFLFFFTGSPQIYAADAHETESIITTACSTCHKFEGKEESRFNLKAPDLMWGGAKYQRDWLIR